MNHKPNMMLVDHTLTIEHAIGDVFAFLSNHENYGLWFPEVLAVSPANDLPHGSVGKIYNETLRLPTGRNRQIVIEVVESEPPHLFVMEGRFAPLHPRTEMRLTPKSAQETTVNWQFFSRSQSTIGRFLINAFVKRTVVRQSKTGLQRLKKHLERLT
ncbi:MAG: SRPBCC family protein [Pseudomonadota bacterium]